MVVSGMESFMRVLTLRLERDVEVMRRRWKGEGKGG